MKEELSYLNNFFDYPIKRFLTREVCIGNVKIGANNKICIQSMTTTDTLDTAATVDQCMALFDAGAQIVRITAPGPKDAENLYNIKSELLKKNYTGPLAADIHFSPKAALISCDYVEKVRINPGNFTDRKRFIIQEYTNEKYNEELKHVEDSFLPLVEKAKTLKRVLRIGSNHGSLSDRIMNKFGDNPLGMVESALEFIRLAYKNNFFDIVVSMKSSNPQVMIQAYRLLVVKFKQEGFDCPIHLGVTEAGMGVDGRMKSAVGIGSLLRDGIGDTIRVSLTENPVNEIPAADKILWAVNRHDVSYKKISYFNNFIKINNKKFSFIKNNLNINIYNKIFKNNLIVKYKNIFKNNLIVKYKNIFNKYFNIKNNNKIIKNNLNLKYNKIINKFFYIKNNNKIKTISNLYKIFYLNINFIIKYFNTNKNYFNSSKFFNKKKLANLNLTYSKLIPSFNYNRLLTNEIVSKNRNFDSVDFPLELGGKSKIKTILDLDANNNNTKINFSELKKLGLDLVIFKKSTNQFFVKEAYENGIPTIFDIGYFLSKDLNGIKELMSSIRLLVLNSSDNLNIKYNPNLQASAVHFDIDDLIINSNGLNLLFVLSEILKEVGLSIYISIHLSFKNLIHNFEVLFKNNFFSIPNLIISLVPKEYTLKNDLPIDKINTDFYKHEFNLSKMVNFYRLFISMFEQNKNTNNKLNSNISKNNHSIDKTIIPPIILKSNFLNLNEYTNYLEKVSVNFGSLLLDGIGDAIYLKCNSLTPEENLKLQLDLLQATRIRLYKTEFISCPSCGRTLFNLEEVSERIRKRTGHLKNLKIAVMGCIVNGPGEMADADFGYVGAGPGKVHLYKEKNIIKANVPAEVADEELVNLIKLSGAWVEN